MNVKYFVLKRKIQDYLLYFGTEKRFLFMKYHAINIMSVSQIKP